MIRDGVYCENQRDVVEEALLSAKQNVKIAVAWINFHEYSDVIFALLKKGIEIKIAVNDDIKNKRYANIIRDLCSVGLQIKMIRMPNQYNYMHHKFCVVDNSMCMMGSFNWTKNANENNYEDLSISHDMNLISGYLIQFDTVWKLSVEDLILLKNPERCEICGYQKAHLCVFNQEGYYQTKADIYVACGCCGLRWINDEYFNVAVYNNLIGIFDKYSDMDEFDFLHGYQWDEEERKRQMDTEISAYLSSVRSNRMGCPIIHAVGIYGWKCFNKDDGENIIQVLWKERYSSSYIQDEYILD